MKIKEVVFALERFAPLPLQESYDNAGLQVGLTEVEASGALLCLDVTEEVIDEAVSLGCNLIVSHHPLLFHGLKTVSDRNYVERCVRKAIQNDVTVYAAHTNLDNAEDGVNFKIAEKLELEQVGLLLPHPVKVKDGGHEYTVMAGSGVIGVLPQPEDSLKFLQRIKSVFHIECLMHNELLQRPVRKVVLCGGAGDFMLEEALNQKADAFLTGGDALSSVLRPRSGVADCRHGALPERAIHERNFFDSIIGEIWSRTAALHDGGRH